MSLVASRQRNKYFYTCYAVGSEPRNHVALPEYQGWERGVGAVVQGGG